MRKRILTMISILALVLAACGGGGDDGSTDTTAPGAEVTEPTTSDTAADTTIAVATTAPEGTTPPAAGGTELIISAVDSEGFSKTSLEAPVGEITVTFENKDPGEEPHNFHITTDTGEYSTLITQGPDTQSVTFTIGTPGEYLYVCDTHTDAMKGTLTVTG